MSERRARRFLIAAVAISLLLHLSLAVFVHWPAAVSREVPQRVRIDRLRALRVIPPPPPAPTPRPSPHPASRNAPRRPPRPIGRTGRRPVAPAQATASPATPTPLPQPSAQCLVSDTSARLAVVPSPPTIPPAARGAGTSGTARIRVSINRLGVPISATVVQSTGNAALDAIALGMARSAQYIAATHRCKSVASTYVFSAKFVAW
jgi:TonB family protein